MIKALILTNNQILITKIEEVPSELGEPDCKLIEPYLINSDGTLSPWLIDISVQESFMIHSDKILTIIEPKATIIEKYQSLTK
jgi:hypothetical protein